MAAEGHRLVTKTGEMSDKLEAGMTTHAAAGNGGPVPSGSFPRKGFEARDARDEIISEKMQFIQGNNGMSPFGLVTASDQDFKWLQKKRETEAAANFDAWAGQNFHSDDPAVRKWHQEINPSYYEERERLMVERAKMALRIKLLKLRGPKTEEDLVTIWGLQTGRIKLDDDWDRIGPYEGKPSDHNKQGQLSSQQRFANGLFSPKRYLSQGDRARAASRADNPFAPSDLGVGAFQQDSVKFPGYVVPDIGRYPAFLQTSVAPYMK
jgi:hypothetical protein